MNTCYKIVTGTNNLNDGYVTVLLDHGSGYVIEKASAWYGKGVTVFEKCVPSSTKLAVENKQGDAWAGSITADSTSLSCDNCDVGKSTTDIVVDGNSDGDKVSPTNCMNGKRCLLSHTICTKGECAKVATGQATCGTNGQFNTLTCNSNTCSCSNGVKATGTACTTDKANICSSCSNGYYRSPSNKVNKNQNVINFFFFFLHVINT